MVGHIGDSMDGVLDSVMVAAFELTYGDNHVEFARAEPGQCRSFLSLGRYQRCTEGKADDLQGILLFYYEAHEMEFDGQFWRPFGPESSIPTHVVVPSQKELKGFDVVTFSVPHSPECSPLSCNGLAEDLRTNEHCLLDSFEEAKSYLEEGRFSECEPGPYRIFAVYSVAWP